MKKLFRRALFWIGFWSRPLLHRLIGQFSAVGNPAIFPPDAFPWTRALSAHWEAIRDEAAAVLRHRDAIPALREIAPDTSLIAVDDKWQSFFLWGYGFKSERNAAHCPVTARVVEQIPGLISAFYSIHAPGLHIPRHYGPNKGMLTCHLALKVPREASRCRIDIDGQNHVWSEGECLVFDDTYFHEVWNDTGDDRVILLIHFERPLRQPGKAIADAFLWLARRSPFVTTTLKEIGAWETRYARAAADD